MSFGTPIKRGNPEEPSISMDYGSPPERGRTTQVHKLNDIAQINALSYRSAFGFIFLMNDTNNVKKVLKVYFLDPRAGEDTEGTEFELGKEYIEYSKRVESTFNFNKEVEIQKEVYLASSSNGPLCPQIYDSYIVENYESSDFLQGLLKKCGNDEEAKNMIQYLIDNINDRYDIGCILMEYAEGYTISSAANSENVIYANIRLLLETGYLHLDLNYGNVMVSGENVRLIDFGKSKKILDLLKSDKDIENFNNIHTIAIKKVLDANDIIQLINYINYFDRIYGVDYNLFKQNFTGIKKSYKDIAVKLNARPNNIIHTDLMNEATQPPSEKSISNTSIQPMKKGLFGSPDSSPQKTGKGLFGSPDSSPQKTGKGLFDSPPENVFKSSMVDSPPENVFISSMDDSSSQKTGKRLFGETDDDNENMNPNPRGLITPRKGGTKRKHKNKSKKTRKNKSNKKRVKLISKK